MKFIKKPVIVEAVKWEPTEHGVNKNKWPWEFSSLWLVGSVDLRLFIPTLEGEMTAQPGDWIIRGVKGEFYPCKPDIFEATYEPVEDK